MIEGGGSTTHSNSKAWLYKYEDASKKLLQMITDCNINYLIEQVAAGAQVKFSL